MNIDLIKRNTYDERVKGHVYEWDLLTGDLTGHNVRGGAVLLMALSGEKIVTCG